MLFNKLKGTGPQEIIFIKKALKKAIDAIGNITSDITGIISTLANKQDKFSSVTIREENYELDQINDKPVLLKSGSFLTDSSSTDSDSGNIVNVAMLRGYHDATKQNVLTAGKNITIQDGVISSDEKYRVINSYEVPQGDTTVNSILINLDTSSNNFNLKKIKILLEISPLASLGNTQNGYIDIRDEDNTYHRYGIFGMVRVSDKNYATFTLETIENDIEFPNVASFKSTNISSSAGYVLFSYGTTASDISGYQKITACNVYVPSNYFPEGTKVTLLGVDF